MRMGIVGLAQSGKKTLFQILTGQRRLSEGGASSHRKGEFPVGVGSIPDERVDRLARVYKPKRTGYAEIEWVFFPAMPREAKARDKWLDGVRGALPARNDGVCLLVRAFTDGSVYHEDGSVDPARDLEKLDLDFAVADLALIETRLERIAKETAKKAAGEREKQKEVLERLKVELEGGGALRGLLSEGGLGRADTERLSGLKFLTALGTMVAVNVDEGLLSSDAAAATKLEELVRSLPTADRETVCFSAKFEAEFVELCDDIEDAEEREEFRKEFGTPEGASQKLGTAAVRALGVVSFLTANRNEVRAWLVRRGATARRAAGVVHTDFEHGFIRAERMRFEDLLAAGSESRLRDQGKVELKGKDYVVEDGDILHILAGK